MRRMISGKAQKYIKDLATNHPDPSAEWGGASYTAGNGIDITNEEISVKYGTGLTVDDETLIIDTNAIATKTDLEDYELKADAFSGSYNDLTDKPTIPAAQVQSDWSQSDNTQVDYIKNKPDLTVYQTTSNLVTSLSSSSTDTQYPSAKCVYDIVGDIESLLAAI